MVLEYLLFLILSNASSFIFQAGEKNVCKILCLQSGSPLWSIVAGDGT